MAENAINDSGIKSVEKKGMRVYSTPDGEFYSVTTVTGWEKRNFFAKWRRDNQDESARVCKRGTNLHSICEKYILNQELNLNEIEENERNLFELLLPEINKIEEVYALETMLWGNITGLAGRVDCIAKYKGEVCIIDFKGSTKPKYKDDIDNYFLQATAYTLLWQERTKQKINKIVIMIANEKGSIQVFEENPMNYISKLVDCIKKFKQDNKLCSP
jgi:genome maintenance exonuclease 1